MLPIDYLPGAHRDFDESFDWYLERSAATAVRFSDAIDAALAIVAGNPTKYLLIDGTHRQYRLKKFPFCIVYRLVDNRMVVVAISHAKRHPDYWRDR